MQEKMELLKELQEIDQELNKVGQSRKELETERSALDADIERVQGMVDSLNADSEALKEQRRELTQALVLEQENVKKAEARLPSIKTQKEYVAVLKEIDTAKKMNKDIEDQIRVKDGEIELLNKEREEKEGELASLREKVDARQGEIAAVLAEYTQVQDEKGSQRDVLLKDLPAQLRKRYQLLFERRGGMAVVEARNGACLGCNMHLPPQLFNSLFQTQEILSCPHCNRLLFVNFEG
ncbi:zinc ribbon domain-containing protein [Desulfuromonas sp. TF]|uniref:zinc ribbon domain-containing protein n=1 Tax=Desulfuromonas sp. TF TaxID=1232410 RepID=UPI0003F6912A|nr:C4-type zinc ribbon domain-containing protein [Desulfuromonas sp. TF]